MNDNSKAKIAQLTLPKTDEIRPRGNGRYRLVVVLMLLGIVGFVLVRHFWATDVALKTSVVPTTVSAATAAPALPLPHNKAPAQDATAAQDKADKVLDASGHIIARRIATISSRVTSKVEQLLIEEGQLVNKDDVLAELDSKQAEFDYEGAKALLLAGQASYQELLSRLKLTQIQYGRSRALYEQNLVSKDDFDTAALTVEQLQAQLLNRQALNQQSEQQVGLSKYNLEQHTIRAPFSGMVIQKNAQVGELISAGNSGGGSIRTGIATIVDMESLEIEVDIAESYINRVTPGQAVIAHLDAYPDWAIKSEVLTIIPTANRQKATIKVRIKLLESDDRILPDMAVKVSFLAVDNKLS